MINNGEKEASVRVKIDDLLKNAGWRFEDTAEGRRNIEPEANTKNGVADYVLYDKRDKPFIVIEAKNKNIDPLTAKEQARKYAYALRAKYIILSNGEKHYLWNLEKGNPEIIDKFPSYESLIQSKPSIKITDSINNIKEMNIDKYFIAESQDLDLTKNSAWISKNDKELRDYCNNRRIRILRNYQLKAIKNVQNSIIEGNKKFLLEMATGTGKTLVSAGIIKMFIRSELVNRVLFLVDRIELENQTKKVFTQYLEKDDIKIIIYKENKQDWNSADVVISTIQSFTRDDKYKTIFKPTDFNLIIADEVHRSLGSSHINVFNYFTEYKLGLTATPKNYLKGVDFEKEDPITLEKIRLLDTYSIFGCKERKATFSYTLKDGINDNILVNPKVIDVRTNITTKLLSEKGLIIDYNDDNIILKDIDFEKKFFPEETNKKFCEVFIDNALKDPITNEIGKSIIFCVSIDHAKKITQILNDLAEQKFPEKYNSDFAVQITSNVTDSQQMAMNFANNNLNGYTKWLNDYNSSKTRVAVTVKMMTTGYDCPDILNLGICRPIFSPIEFIQIKGRGTRLYSFEYEDKIEKKEFFKLFDFFAVCEYFENKFKYDKKIDILNFQPIKYNNSSIEYNNSLKINKIIYNGPDSVSTIEETDYSKKVMKVDNLNENFESDIESIKEKDIKVQKIFNDKDIESLELYLNEEVFNKPEKYYNPEKLKESLGLDRNLSTKEIAMKLLGFIPKYDTKSEKLDKEFEKFIQNKFEKFFEKFIQNKKELNEYIDKISFIKEIFKSYILDSDNRNFIDKKEFGPYKKELNEYINKISFIKKIFQSYILDSDIRNFIDKKEFGPLTMYIKEYLKNLSRAEKKIVYKCIREYSIENDICYENFK